jgi:hypothetical protein
MNVAQMEEGDIRAVLEKVPYYPDEIWKFTAMTERFPTVEDAPAVNPLPCKIGDTVWGIRYHTGVPYIKQGMVSEMAYLEDMRLAIAVKFAPKYNTRGFWGVTIFATREECEAALGGKDNG